MGIVQKLVYSWLPGAEHQSRCWVFRCPSCQNRTSIHDLGGVRYLAYGNPYNLVQCKHCAWTGMAQLFKQDSPLEDSREQSTAPTDHVPHPVVEPPLMTPDATGPAVSRNARLWIDGVGCWLVSWRDDFAVGGPLADRNHLSIQADLSRVHLAIHRREESYQLEPVGRTTLNGQGIVRTTHLKDHDQIGLGDDVRLRFRIPSKLGLTAVLEIVSGHRASRQIDGVVLLHHSCQLGSSSDAHITCSHWNRQVVLFIRDGDLWCRADTELELNGQPVTQSRPLNHGDVLVSENSRIRVEYDQ